MQHQQREIPAITIAMTFGKSGGCGCHVTREGEESSKRFDILCTSNPEIMEFIGQTLKDHTGQPVAYPYRAPQYVPQQPQQRMPPPMPAAAPREEHYDMPSFMEKEEGPDSGLVQKIADQIRHIAPAPNGRTAAAGVFLAFAFLVSISARWPFGV